MSMFSKLAYAAVLSAALGACTSSGPAKNSLEYFLAHPRAEMGKFRAAPKIVTASLSERYLGYVDVDMTLCSLYGDACIDYEGVLPFKDAQRIVKLRADRNYTFFGQVQDGKAVLENVRLPSGKVSLQSQHSNHVQYEFLCSSSK